MRTSKTARSFIPVVSFVVLSICWISCNQSTTTGEVTTTAADTTITGVLEMRPPGSLIPKDTAADWINAYRRAGGGPFSTQIVIHHPDAVKFYIDSVFNKFTPSVTLPKNHVWRVAYSPMFYRQPGGPKLSLCVVPCIVDTSNAKVYEFFTEMAGNTAYYQEYFLKLYNSINSATINGNLKSTKTDTIGFVFNEGQLWP